MSTQEVLLPWTDWTPFEAGSLSRLIPESPGLYRVRHPGRAPLIYLGQTRRSLRERLHALRRGTFAASMPFNDPHTAAPGLWAYRIEDSYEFEVSWCDQSGVEQRDLHTFEAWALALHRQQFGESTLLNHGRFHPAWSRPTNRSAGRPGARLTTRIEYPSSMPLSRIGQLNRGDWMGLDWSVPIPLGAAPSNAPSNPGLYLLSDGQEIIYIGQTGHLGNRIQGHRNAGWPPKSKVSWSSMSPDTPVHHLLELEVDLLGAYIDSRAQAPQGQF